MAVITYEDFQNGIDRRKSEQVADMKGLYECKNAYVTNGFAIKKRPGFERISATGLDSNSKGLFIFNRKLYTVSHVGVSQPTLSGFGVGTSGPISTTIETLILPNPASPVDPVSRVWQFLVFNRKLYVVVEYDSGDVRHWFGGTTTAGMSVITDANCPNTKSVIVHASKVYAIGTNASGQAYVKYSATENPVDWTSPGNASGTLGLPVGLESPQQDEIVAIGSFRDKLVVFMTNNLQLWNTDPDPANITLDSVVENAHTTFINSIAPIANDLFYLNHSGFDSAGQMLYTDTIQDVDVGSPISDLVVSQINSHAATYEPKSINFTGEGQYLCAIEKELFVFSYSAASRLAAWSRYTLSDVIRDLTHFRNYCFMRLENSARDNYVYCMNPDKYIDDTDGEAPEVQITNSYQTLGAPGRWKKIYGMDAMFNGTANIQHRWDARSPDEKTIKVPLTGDTRPGQMIPVELMTTELSFDITQTDNAAFQFNGISYYFEPLGEF